MGILITSVVAKLGLGGGNFATLVIDEGRSSGFALDVLDIVADEILHASINIIGTIHK